MAKAKHWHLQDWQVIATSGGRRSIMGPDRRCLETNLSAEGMQHICSFVNRVYTLGLKRGRQSVFRERAKKKPKKKKKPAKRVERFMDDHDGGGYVG